MRDELLPYYQRELTFIRQIAAEFKEKYPAVASGLLLDANACEDPHVERLIEAFALIAGRIHHKIDDEFPEITESLLEVLYPHYLRPVPSQAIVQFQLDPSQSTLTSAVELPAGTMLHSVAEEGNACSFRSAYPVKLWPLCITAASVSTTNRFASPGNTGNAAAILRIRLECAGGSRFSQLGVDSLRFYLHGESAAVYTLYEFIFLYTTQISLRAIGGSGQAILPLASLRQVGFRPDEGLLPYSKRSFLGYRLLQEYFTFPEKFLFFEITGLDRVSLAEFDSSLEIVLALKDSGDKHRLIALEQAVTAETFQLGCTPVVNLFERIAEPIRISHTKTEYRIIPDLHRQSTTEVYSVDRVASMSSYNEEPIVYPQFYSVNHHHQGREQKFWYAHRRSAFRKNDSGTEVYLSIVDLNFQPSVPGVDLLSVQVTCTNRDAPARLRLSGTYGELEVEGAGVVLARCLRKPTQSARPLLRRGLQWRLISHLSLNHLSIVEGGREALQEILRLYDFEDNLAIRKQIAGITAVESRPCVSRVWSPTGFTFCRGTSVTIDFDESEYVGSGVFLLSSVLESFLALYAALNSFTRLTVRTSKGVIKQWPARAGEQILL